MSQEDHGASEVNHPEEILWVVFPANDDATIVMEPSEPPFDLPPTPVAPKDTAILRWFSAARGMVWCNQFHAEALADFRIERIAVVSPVADQSVIRVSACW